MANDSRSWFTPEPRIAALEERARAWLGTPFRANARVPGREGGVSCHLLVAALMVEVGALPDRPWPRENPNHSISQTHSIVEPYLDAFEGVAPAAPPILPGDILGFKVGGCTHHLAVALRLPEMVHAVRRHGVMVSRVDDPMWARRLTRIWRVNP